MGMQGGGWPTDTAWSARRARQAASAGSRGLHHLGCRSLRAAPRRIDRLPPETDRSRKQGPNGSVFGIKTGLRGTIPMSKGSSPLRYSSVQPLEGGEVGRSAESLRRPSFVWRLRPASCAPYPSRRSHPDGRCRRPANRLMRHGRVRNGACCVHGERARREMRLAKMCTHVEIVACPAACAESLRRQKPH